MRLLRRLLSLPLILLPAITFACGGDSGPPTPAPTETPTITPIPTWTLVPSTPTATPPPTATPLPDLAPGDAVIVGGVVYTRKEPSTQSEQLGSIGDLEAVTIAQRVQGENWLLGQQTWVTSTPAWATEWLQLEDGSYVYSPFVFILREGEASPLELVPAGVEKWIDVDISEQQARAMAGDEAVFTANISSGEQRFPTPQGSFAVEPDGRISVVRMTASQAGYDTAQASYDVERVLFTQYFDQKGNALHLNYWRPHEVFGNTATSHGCIGLELHEAQWLWLFGTPGMRVEIHE